MSAVTGNNRKSRKGIAAVIILVLLAVITASGYIYIDLSLIHI